MTSKNVSDADNAYYERNQLVAALSKLFPAGLKETTIDGWDDDWHNCVYIDLPTGQVSWHFHKRELPLFHHLKPYIGEWDGHDTPEKYQRLNALSAAPQLSEAEMVEIVADLEHQQWMHWSQAVAHTVSFYQLKTWQHLWVPYEQLPEDEKEKDRVWASKTLRALNLIGGKDE